MSVPWLSGYWIFFLLNILFRVISWHRMWCRYAVKISVLKYWCGCDAKVSQGRIRGLKPPNVILESAERIRKETKRKHKTAKEASLPFWTRAIPKNQQTLWKFKVPDFRDISVILIARYRYSSSLNILSSSFYQGSKHCLLVIYCLTNVFQ